MAIELLKRPNKAAAIPMLTNAVVVFLVWCIFFVASRTNPLSGLDRVQGFLVWFIAAIPAALIISACIALARQLWRGGLDAPKS